MVYATQNFFVNGGTVASRKMVILRTHKNMGIFSRVKFRGEKTQQNWDLKMVHLTHINNPSLTIINHH